MYDNEGVRVQSAPTCYLCGREGNKLYKNLHDCLFGAPGVWDILHCPCCGLLWLDPRPVFEDIGKLYKRYYTHETDNHVPQPAGLWSKAKNSALAVHLGYKSLGGGLLQKGLGKIVSWFGPTREIIELSVMTLRGQKKGKLLDIGCGKGQFLARMRNLGWETIGVESDGQAAKAARECFGLNVYVGTLAEANFADDTFDAITMYHVIEHIYDPISTLRECQRVLNKDGELVVVTPNVESLGHRLFHNMWRGLEVPRHWFLFSPRTLRMCAEAAGLQVAEVRTIAKQARSAWPASRLLCRNGILPDSNLQQLSLRLQLEGYMFWVTEYILSKTRPYGEEALMVASRGKET